MKGFIEHVINNGDEVLEELQMDLLNESVDIVDEIDGIDFDDEFANEETPGELGGNIDGVTDINCDVDDEDLWDEDKSDTYNFDYIENLDESCQKTLQEYQGWSDEDLEDEELFQECQECADDEFNLFEYGMKGKSGRKPDGVLKKAKKAVTKTAKRVGAVYNKAFGK